jgi:transposase
MLDLELNGAAGGRGVKRAVGELSGAAGGVSAGVPGPELVEGAKRRRFTAQYKLRVLRESEACSQPGEIGALLRREGLYSSILSEWRRQRDAGALEAFGRPPGRKASHPLETENGVLRRRAERAEADLAKARKVIEAQGNVYALLGELLEPRDAEESTKR